MVCLSDTVVICAKTAEPIEMPFGFWIRVVASSNHVLDDGLDPACEVAILTGKGAARCKYMDCCNNGCTDQDVVWDMDSGWLWLAHKARIRCNAHWRHLANTIELCMCVGDAAFLSNYFDHSLLLSRIALLV